MWEQITGTFAYSNAIRARLRCSMGLGIVVVVVGAAVWADCADRKSENVDRKALLLDLSVAISKLERASGSIDQTADRMRRILAPLGHDHAVVRAWAIQSQLKQAETDAWVVLGDSIVEGATLPRPCGRKLINAGIGGMGVRELSEIAPKLLSEAQPAMVALAVGVNDAMRRAERSREVFGREYKVLVERLEGIGARVVLMNILPVEDGRMLGTRYFDSERIVHFNQEIAQLAGRERLLIDVPAIFRSGDYAPTGSTVDGVHLTAKSYALVHQAMVDGIERAFCPR